MINKLAQAFEYSKALATTGLVTEDYDPILLG
jgi:hypothetical protein